MARNLDFDDDECMGMQASSGRSDEDGSYVQEEEEGIQAESPGSLTDDMTYSHIFHSDADMIDRYHGISSPFALCNRLQLRTLALSDPIEPYALQELLRELCETAGRAEPFPSYNDQFPIQLPPKQQALAAVTYFFKHIDCATDIFVEQNLLATLERVYSQPPEPGDDTWAVCLKALILLVLGVEISTQADSALFGDFACSMLPSRAALVSSRLLNTPRLINVQTLILLSVAAQQFDPPGWSELLFIHACMLARTMGLHKSGILSSGTSPNDDAAERAKVLQSLYIRDKSLCITRGSVSWLPSYDCNITTQLKLVVERQASFSSRIRLAMIQDELYHMTCAASGSRRDSHPRISQPATPKSIRQQLDQLASDCSILSGLSPSYLPRDIFIAMEFLSTRIVALKLDPETRHTSGRLFADARASCFLLLLAHGDRNSSVIDAYHSSTGTDVSSIRNGTSPTSEPNTKSFTALLDVFSVPAFFVLFESLVFQETERDGGGESGADWDLLRKVSSCYTKGSSHLPPQGYHSRVARILNQLIDNAHLFQRSPSNSYSSGSSLEVAAESTQSHSSSNQQLPPEPEATIIPSVPSSILNGHMSDLSHVVASHTSSSCGPFTWESLLSVPTTLDPPTTLDAQSIIHPSGTGSSTDLLTQLLDVSQPHSEPILESIQWHSLPPDQPRAKKRLRTSDD
ncbi:conserved hypothetical protein [Talaromyces stipitatus ATCC 10500]|nr:uncharacterized protein TSTA_009720 [Talaromyces stipitatus ATCC 10500]AWS21689.1 C6 transcription factor [Talaromyces stipitatus]EED15852.1 conserved hypothetical protein [Talaromyces stipitatus ATCC 10500]